MTLADLRTVHECCSSGEDLHVGTTRAKKKKRECEDVHVGTTRATMLVQQKRM